jgi:hypothetical protein
VPPKASGGAAGAARTPASDSSSKVDEVARGHSKNVSEDSLSDSSDSSSLASQEGEDVAAATAQEPGDDTASQEQLQNKVKVTRR